MSYISYETMNKKLKKVVPEAVGKFIIWYYSDPNTRLPFEKFRTCHDMLKKKSYEDCLEWLRREDAQKAVQVYHKEMKLFEQTQLYDAMRQKAMEGDIRAADWLMKFYDSDYFDQSNDEIDDFLNDIDIPALKKKGE